MSVITELNIIQNRLNGKIATDHEIDELSKKLPKELVTPLIVSIIKSYPLAGVSFSLDETKDESKVGADLEWFSPSGMIEEALRYYPGIVVHKLGFLPIATCTMGTGDPYFLKMKGSNLDDPPLVRIPHDGVTEDDNYQEDEIQIVCSSLSKFFSFCKID